MESKVDLMMGDEAEQMRKELAQRESEEAAEAVTKAEPAKLPKAAAAAAAEEPK